MLLQNAVSLAVFGLLAFTSNQFTASAEPIAVVHGTTGPVIPISANYLAAFDSDDVPEPAFELVDVPSDISSKLISLKKRATSCAKYYAVRSGDTCTKIANNNGISTNAFMGMNDQINKGCTNLHINKKYCVKNGSSKSSTSKTSKPKSSTSKSTSSSSGSCTKTHKVRSSDTCSGVAKKYGITLSKFYSWNPKVHKNCDNLDDGKSYCVAKGSSSSTSTSSKKSSTSSKKVKSKVTSLISKTSSDSSEPEKRKKLQSDSKFTYYWIAQQDDYTGGSSVAIKTCAGKTIANVNSRYADALVMEGTGVVGNKIVNLGACSCSNYKCFEEMNRSEEPYGITAYGGSLRPYVSIAANDLPKNSKIYVPQLDGWSLPGSDKKHNGCLLVEDQSWSFSGHHIDFFVYKMDNYQSLDKQHRLTKVDIYEGGNCRILNYL